jgi:hypothetical protein
MELFWDGFGLFLILKLKQKLIIRIVLKGNKPGKKEYLSGGLKFF